MTLAGATYSVGKEKGVIVEGDDAAGRPESVFKSWRVLEVFDEGGTDFCGGPVLGRRPWVRLRGRNDGLAGGGGHGFV